MNIFDSITRTCSQYNVNVRDITFVACTVKSGNPQGTGTRTFSRNNRSRITTATLGVTATEHLTNFTALTFYSGSTDDDGTFILIPVAILFLDRTATITTAETITDVVASIYQDIGFRNNSRVTAAIDLLDTGLITTIDDDMTLLACSRQVVSLITTAIDRLYLIREFAVCGTVTRKNLALRIFLYLSGRIDMNRHLTRRCSIIVVTTEDSSHDRGRIVRTANHRVFSFLIEHNAFCGICDSFVYRYSNVTIYVGHCRGVAQTATVGVTDKSTCQPDGCSIAGRCFTICPSTRDSLLIVSGAAIGLGIRIRNTGIDTSSLCEVSCNRSNISL